MHHTIIGRTRLSTVQERRPAYALCCDADVDAFVHNHGRLAPKFKNRRQMLCSCPCYNFAYKWTSVKQFCQSVASRRPSSCLSPSITRMQSVSRYRWIISAIPCAVFWEYFEEGTFTLTQFPAAIAPTSGLRWGLRDSSKLRPPRQPLADPCK